MAQRIQHKRSSIIGRRPAEQYLEPGEIALNTNQEDPGLFFETNTGAIAKAGPAHVGPLPPTTEVGYGNGESWYDTGNGTFNLWIPSLNRWVPMLSPLFGGASTAIFVGSEFPEATDDLSNDGYARPFASLNRAMLEVARRSIAAGRSDEVFNSRFSVILLPGRNVVCNDPGLSYSEFEGAVSTFANDQAIDQLTLRAFNSPNGGLLVPRGTSIFGLDLRKTEIVPTSYPFWSRALYEDEPELIEDRTAILKWTGNSYFTSFTFKDKVNRVSVNAISGDDTDAAVMTSLRPHGFRTLITSTGDDQQILAGDVVNLTYPPEVSRLYKGSPTVSEGEYYAEPLTPYTFRLRRITDGDILLRNELPETGIPGAFPANYFDLSYTLTTHHRLTAISFASTTELNEYYSKAQRAFAEITFAGTINNAEVAAGETVIVSQTTDVPTNEIDSSKNGSPYVFNVSVRSNYGLCGLLADGATVGGFKSALTCNFTCVSLQTDADTFEVYSNNEWISLKQAYANSAVIPLSEVTSEEAFNYLVASVKVENIRYFLRDALDILADNQKSSGLIDDKSDTRHYVTLATNGSFVQTVTSFAIGVAINYWTKNGAQISVTNANSNFGGIALRAEGFSGIGTVGGAESPDTGFTIQGIRRPAAVTTQMVSGENIKRFFLNANIVSANTTSITLSEPFDLKSIQPYTLKPGTAIWAEDYSTGTTYKAIIKSSGAVLSNDKRVIYVDSGTNELISPATPSTPAVPGTGAITALNGGDLPDGSGYVDGFYTTVPLTGGSGTGATADITVSGGEVSAVTIVSGGTNYVVGDTLSASAANLGGGTPTDFSITVSTVNTGTPAVPGTPAGGLISSTLSLPYVRRFVDPRSPVDRFHSLWIRNTSQSHRAPEVGSILRFAEKPQAGVSNLIRPGVQLDPGQNGGWGHVFQIIDARTKNEGDNPNIVEPLITPTEGTQDYYVTVAPVDYFHQWLPSGNNGFSTGTLYYPKGYYATSAQRVFYPIENDLESVAASRLVPGNEDSVWTRAKTYELCQPITRTWYHADGFDSADDPLASAYADSSVVYTYPRGIQFDKANAPHQFVIDEDSGASDLGITSGGLVTAGLCDPWWSPTKLGMTRFLTLLGFSYSQLSTLVVPQLWSSRNLSVATLPAVGDTGYALSTGTWPIEFNRPSTIRCGNHTWEWCGFLNYAKGLPKYQGSQLSLRQRFDFISTEMWGGVVYATGNTERGEYVITGKTVAGGTGSTLLETDSPLPSYGVQNVTA